MARAGYHHRIKAALTRLGIRNFNPKLKKAPERLEYLCTPEGEQIPPNTLAELRRDMERRRLVAEEIRQIEKARLERLKQAPTPDQISWSDEQVEEVLRRRSNPNRKFVSVAQARKRLSACV
jgi:hypothetical protein